jgi:signal peptidase I
LLDLHDWTTYVMFGMVVGAGLGVAYYWEHYDIVRFEEQHQKSFNEPQIVQGMWRCGHLADTVQQGMFVVYKRPGDGDRHAGRVVAVEGQRVEVQEKHVLVDGANYDIKGTSKTNVAETPEVLVPRHCVFVLCDERARVGSAETDSRTLGPIPLEAVTHAFWPLEKKKD